MPNSQSANPLSYRHHFIMNPSDTHHQRIANMSFASVYPHYLAKAEKKGRTKEELHQVITWLTGFDEAKANFLEIAPASELLLETLILEASASTEHLAAMACCAVRSDVCEEPGATLGSRGRDSLHEGLADRERGGLFFLV